MSGDVVADVAPRPLSRLTVIGIAAAAGLVPLNSTMIAVALPEIADDFDISVGRVSILVTVYLVAMLVGQPLNGRLSDRVGPHRTVAAALVGLAVFSVAAALATSFGFLVTARVLQAACASALVPGSQSLLRSATVAAERGWIFGLMGSILGVGAASGPIVGGVLIELFGWEAIFLVNLPVIAVALAVTLRFGSRVSGERTTSPSRSATRGRISNRVFMAAFSTQALTTQAQYTLLLLTPVMLAARGWRSSAVGLALSALTVGMIVFGPLGGRAGDRYGRRSPVLVGVALATVGVVIILTQGASVEPALLIVGLAVFGVGLGAAIPNITIAALESVPERQSGSAAGVLSMSRYVGSITASLLFSAVVAADAGGSRVVLAISAFAMALAIGAGGRLPRGR